MRSKREEEERAYAAVLVGGVLGHALLAEVREELAAEHGEHVLELVAFLDLCVCHGRVPAVVVVGEERRSRRWRDEKMDAVERLERAARGIAVSEFVGNAPRLISRL